MTLARKIAALRQQLNARAPSAPTLTEAQGASLLARLEALAASPLAHDDAPLAPHELTDPLLVKHHELHRRLTALRTT